MSSKRTLTNLYNPRQAGKAAWLAHAHAELDAAVATAYGWADYTAALKPARRRKITGYERATDHHQLA